MNDHDLHVWLSAEDYAWLCRQSREQDRSKNAVMRRLIRKARAESMDDDEGNAREAMGALYPKASY